MIIHAFNPGQNATVNLSGSSTSSVVQFDVQTPAYKSQHVRLANAGSGTIFIEFGSSAAAPSLTTSMPVLAGTVEIVTPPGGAWVAGVCAAGVTTTLYITPGSGI